MLLTTQGDARGALSQLVADIDTTTTAVQQKLSSSNFLTGLFGGNDVAQASASILLQLQDSAARAAADLTGDDSDAITDEQKARLQELQNEVISDRKLVGDAISSVDWTYGDFVADVAQQTENIASQAVSAVASGLNINWTVVEIAAALAALALGYALYRRVRG